MDKAKRTLVYDNVLRIEATRLTHMSQSFPNHFHAYYVIGLMESGTRRLLCKGKEYGLGPGNVVLFNPGDNHACVCDGGDETDYRGIHLPKEVMLDLSQEITGQSPLPCFSSNVICDVEIASCLRALHKAVAGASGALDREEKLCQLVSLLLGRYAHPFEHRLPACSREIEQACAYMEEHFARRIDLAQLCSVSGLSRSTLLRAFTKLKGVTPYVYLESIRITRAKTLLRQGVSPVEAALQTGFSDQSHFTNYFSRIIGLTPGAYRDIFLAKNGPEETRYEK